MHILLYISFFVSRLINLGSIPVFNDESIYIDWGYRAINIDGFSFYSLYDSKQPLVLWLFGISQKFISDPLLASRFISVVFGFFSLLGITLIAKQLFPSKKFHFAGLIYIFTPIFLFFDKQALMESAVFCVGIYLYLLFNIFKKSDSTLHSMLFGLLIGLSLYIKSSILMYLLALVPLFILEVRKNNDQQNFKLYAHSFIALATSGVVLIPLLSQDLFWKTIGTNDRFVLNFYEILSLPVTVWFKNTVSFLSISSLYISPVAVPLLVFIVLRAKKLSPRLRDFFIYFSGVVILAILLTRSLNVRYTMPLLFGFPIFFEYLVHEYRLKKKILNSLYMVFFLPQIVLSFLLLSNYEAYFKVLNLVPRYSQYEEYLVSWTSGIAAQQAVEYIQDFELAENQKVFIGLRTDAGNPENTVIYSFYNNKNTIVSYFDSQVIQDFAQYDCLKSPQKFIFVSRDTQFGGTQQFWQEKARFYNLEAQNFVAVHVIKENCEGKTLEIN